jgi:hypothetical protein
MAQSSNLNEVAVKFWKKDVFLKKLILQSQLYALTSLIKWNQIDAFSLVIPH